MANNSGIETMDEVTVYSSNNASLIGAIQSASSAPDGVTGVPADVLATHEQMGQLERELLQLLWAQLASMSEVGAKQICVADWLTDNSPLFYRQWLLETLQHLQRQQFIEIPATLAIDTLLTAKVDVVQAPQDVESAWQHWRQVKRQWHENRNLQAQVTLVEATLQELPNILRGQCLATEVMFPNSSMTLVEGIYKNNVTADYFNAVLADMLMHYLRQRIAQDANARINILEIGAGTGGTSAVLFKRLQPLQQHIGEYCYTDVSSAFLQHAEREFVADNPYINAQIYDVSKPLADQPIKGDHYDVVVATNVLHATANMATTLRNAKALLHGNGLLMVNELSQHSLFSHLTFGLLEGWWLFDDAEARMAGGCCIASESWRELLQRQGYRETLFPCAAYHHLGQQIIVSESDGRVSQQALAAEAPGPLAAEPVERRDPPAPKSGVSDGNIKSQTVAFIKQLIADTLKIPLYKIDEQDSFDKYGIDSILVVQLTNALAEIFADVSSTLIFECQNIDLLADHFIEFESEVLHKQLGLGGDTAPSTKAATSTATNPEVDGSGRPGFGLPSSGHPATGRHQWRAQWRQSQGEGFRVAASNGPAAEQAQQVLQTPVDDTQTPADVAIIGIAGRYPQAYDLEQFWQNLVAGKNCVAEIPAERWSWQDYFDEEKGVEGKIYTCFGGFIDGYDEFDPLFFQISPREAERTDPQERLFLQTVYAAIEDAGYQPQALTDNKQVGVFVGVMNGNYSAGANFWSIANRISYNFDFTGPSLAVDTACSSSLTAIHLGIESLQNQTSELVIAGGVNLILAPLHLQKLCAMTMLSSGDQLRAFADNADGFIDGEGVGAVLLKPLAKAVASGDHIYGVIKSSMVNAGGKTSGFTVPNPNAQADCIAEAIRRAGINSDQIGYIEAHGTGTALGDPIEIAGLNKAFSRLADGTSASCAIGSVKSNIGHLESAAGIAGLSKILLQMQHAQLVPSLHAEPVNPRIDFSRTPFYVQQQVADWPRPKPQEPGQAGECARTAGISSFGAGGANAHLIVQEYLAAEPVAVAPLPEQGGLCLLSARTEAQLQDKARQLSQFAKQQLQNQDLADVFYTLQVGREPMEYRLAISATTVERLCQALDDYTSQRSNPHWQFFRAKRSPEMASYLAQADLDQRVQQALQKQDLDSLIEPWLKGFVVDWQAMYPASADVRQLKRRSLPTYPFARKRYWLQGEQTLMALGQVELESAIESVDQQPALVFEPCWRPLEPRRHATASTPSPCIVYVCDTAMGLAQSQIHRGIDFRLLPMPLLTSAQALFDAGASTVELAEDFQRAILTIFETLQQVLGQHAKQALQVQFWLPAPLNEAISLWSSVSGLLKTAQLEVSKLDTLLLHIESGQSLDLEAMASLAEQLRASHGPASHFRLSATGLQYQYLEERVATTTAQPSAVWRDRGVYLITGGAGGLGALFAREIAAQVQQPVLILTGRSAIDDSKQQLIESLQASGAEVCYRPVDVADGVAVTALVTQVVAEYGAIHGVIHSAGVVLDQPLRQKTAAEFERVFAAKVAGLLHLDQATQQQPLDLFVAFSSVAAVLGNPAQADYACANGFMDAYCRRRQQWQQQGLRQGRSLSLNWPLWRDGGMQVDPQVEAFMQRASGMTAMATEAGLAAFYRAYGDAANQLMVIAGDAERLRELLLADPLSQVPEATRVSAAGAVASEPAADAMSTSLKQQLSQTLSQLVGEVLKVETDDIDPDGELNDYGFDSVTLTEFSNRLNQQLALELTPAIFYEYTSLNELQQFLLEDQRDHLITLFGLSSPAAETPVPSVAHQTPLSTPVAEAIEPSRETAQEPLAVIGISGQFPAAADLDSFWQNLLDERDCVTEVPAERWSWQQYWGDPRESGNTCNVKYAAFIDGIDEFDPLFFGISPREAMLMDPQQRLLMQHTWKAIEDAGYAPSSLSGSRTAIFVGTASSGYGELAMKSGRPVEAFSSTGMVASVGPNRLSFLLNLQGASCPVETACSSSLVAIHRAMQEIRSDHCDMAIVGGVNTLVTPEVQISLNKAGVLSQDGHSKTFSAQADGYGRGEGVAILLLKRLSLAERDGDRIQGLIIASAENHGGRATSLTAPNPKAQAQLLQAAYADIDPATINYIEAHGTGTELGDPIEINGLKSAFANLYGAGGVPSQQMCGIGTVKSNIGHLELAAGIAGVAKVLLQMKHQTLVASLNSQPLNPYIKLQDSPFYIVDRQQPWPSVVVDGVEQPRRAGVSSFGFGGSNAHVVLQEYRESRPERLPAAGWPVLILISGLDERALLRQVQALLAHLNQGTYNDADLYRIAYTLQVGRDAMEARLALQVETLPQLQQYLADYVELAEDLDDGLPQLDSERGCYCALVSEHKSQLSQLAPSGDRLVWLNQAEAPQILKLWSMGLNLDWQALYQQRQWQPRKVALPTYAFDRQSYWVDVSAADKVASTPSQSEPEAVEIDSSPVAVAAGPLWRDSMRGMGLRQCLIVDVKQMVAELLDLPASQLKEQKNFADFGFESITLAEFAKRLSERLQIKTTPATFFSHSTLADLADYYLQQAESPLQRLFQAPASAAKTVAARPQPRPAPTRSARPAAPVTGASSRDDKIAIIGMSGRLPQARNIDEFWQIVRDGRDVVDEIPVQRFDWRDYYSDDVNDQGHMHSKWSGCVDGVAEFEPLFFEISPRDAERMDPRQRLLLQESWKALEHAGYGARQLESSTVGMFVGVETGDYQTLTTGPVSVTANHEAILAARLSYFLNLSGPNLAINTACSSALVALHQACNSLRLGECDSAIAAGVNLMLTPQPYLAMSQAGMLSPDGKCYTFDQRANGMVPGEAVVAVVVKPLAQAQRDGDPIDAVIEASGLNYDGKTNGITAPCGAAQTQLLRDIYQRHQIDARQIDCVISHGTGTRLGDPVEINALNEAFKADTADSGFCALSSTKPNIGHTFAASGLVSLIALVQSLRHRQLPPSIHCEQINDYIDWQQSPFYINQRSEPWLAAPGHQRMGAVSAFGMSGTNAHFVVSEYVDDERVEDEVSGAPQLLLLSAKTLAALEQKVQDLHDYFVNAEFVHAEQQPLAAVAYTLIDGRQHFAHRLALVVADWDDAMTQLQGLAALSEWSQTTLPAQALYGVVDSDYQAPTATRQLAGQMLQQLADAGGSDIEALQALADFYRQGYDLDWPALFGEQPPRRLHLPTYPFSRDSYWINERGINEQVPQSASDEAVAISPSAAAPAVDTAMALYTFTENWREQSVALAVAADIGHLICHLPDTQMQAQFRSQLQQFSPASQVLFIEQGQSLPLQLQKAQQTLGEVAAVLLWQTVDGNETYDVIVECIQALAQQDWDCPHLLLAGHWQAASDSQDDVTLSRCYADSWIGFQRSLGLVMPATQVSVLMAERGADTDIGSWVPHLLTEMARQSVGQSASQTTADPHPCVLWQEGEASTGWRRQVLHIEQTQRSAANTSVLKVGGTYLITGGCGGLGLLFAQHLAQNYQATLILTGRSALSEAKQQQLQALRDMGAEVHYLAVDVCDAQAMERQLTDVLAQLGPLQGVLHAAGIEGHQSILDKSMDDFNRVADAKVAGTLALHQVLLYRRRQGAAALDFIAYFSSSSAILGDFGFCDYAVGNRFQMLFAQHQQALLRDDGTKVLAVNWPLWQDGGMGQYDRSNVDMYLKSSGQRYLYREEGLQIFEQLLAEPVTQQLVLVGQLARIQRFLRLSDSGTTSTAAAPVAQSVATPAQQSQVASVSQRHQRPELQGLSIEQCVNWDLKDIIGRLLKMSRAQLIDSENLANFGFDSISLAELARLLSDFYQLDISPSVLFGYSTIEQLTAYFVSDHEVIIRAFYSSSESADSDDLAAGDHATASMSGADKNAVSAPVSQPADIAQSQSQPLSATVAPAAAGRMDIAIIGMSGRFPQADNVEEFWQLLVQGRDAVQEIPARRFDWRTHLADGDDALCHWLGAIDGEAEFDPLFFEITPHDAEQMDPRQRLLLQESWRALEDAGLGANHITQATVGMFVGVEPGDYQALCREHVSVTGNHDAVLAARLSYFLNLSGPNLAINTACSSGLVAVHQACLSLWQGECDTAIAASANLMLTPQPYRVMAEAGMLSNTGKCRAFAASADGMVPAEAVVAMVLKPLSLAQQAGDPIYASIVASGINYDGKTNGITAPSGVSQRQLLESVYREADIDAADIGYVVTHGTGTRLGDPIEINALHDVFKQVTDQAGICAITSTKSNIGHSFAASGLVSLISLVQALQHQTIPASLHCDEPNQYINWQHSPLYLNQHSQPWSVATGKHRLGAVSSFGMSGTNAHLVVREVASQPSAIKPLTPGYLLLLSAKNARALEQKAVQLLAYLQNQDSVDMALVSDTLLLGRQHFNHRCALVVADVDNAIYTLQQLTSQDTSPHIVRAQVSASFTAQKVLQQQVQQLAAQLPEQVVNSTDYRDVLLALAELYCQGYQLPSLTANGGCRRLHLPTYPFLRQSYWLPAELAATDQAEAGADDGVAAGPVYRDGANAWLHPLIERNSSGLQGLRFSASLAEPAQWSRFATRELAFLQPLLVLEMARAGAVLALRNEQRVDRQPLLQVSDVQWSAPMANRQSLLTVADQLHLAMYPLSASAESLSCDFEVYRDALQAQSDPEVHCQGRLTAVAAPLVPVRDLAALRQQWQPSDRQQIMALLQETSSQGTTDEVNLQRLWCAEGQLLAEVTLPQLPADDECLSRDLINAVMDTVNVLYQQQQSRAATVTAPLLPLSLASLQCYGDLTSELYVLAQLTEASAGPEQNWRGLLDIDVCHADGTLVARFNGLQMMQMHVPAVCAPVTGAATQSDGNRDLLLVRPYLETIDWSATSEPVVAADERWLVVCDAEKMPSDAFEQFAASVPNMQVLRLPSKLEALSERYQRYALSVFERLQAYIQRRSGKKLALQLVVPSDVAPLQGLGSLLTTAQLEYPSLQAQLVTLNPQISRVEQWHCLQQAAVQMGEQRVIAEPGQTFVERLQTLPATDVEVPWRDGGVYLISGGLGGLGLIFARDILAKTQRATVILTGRSATVDDLEQRLPVAPNLGHRVIYRALDVADADAVANLMADIRQQFARLDGILHSAGINRDNFIIKKSASEFADVLQAKVHGLVNLDEASKDFALDFFVMFSSVAARLGSFGQSDYATANGFMDHYAEQRRQLQSIGMRSGKSLSINWPLWQQGGMQVDRETEQMMYQQSGMLAMQTESGLTALYQALELADCQCLVLEGDGARLSDTFALNKRSA